MGRGKNPKTDIEHTKLQKITHENQRLKKELSRLRKSVSRMENGFCAKCLGIESEMQEEQPIDPPKSLKTDRKCHKCVEGVLTMFKYMKAGVEHYYRRCTHCTHRTQGKKLTPDVKP